MKNYSIRFVPVFFRAAFLALFVLLVFSCATDKTSLKTAEEVNAVPELPPQKEPPTGLRETGEEPAQIPGEEQALNMPPEIPQDVKGLPETERIAEAAPLLPGRLPPAKQVPEIPSAPAIPEYIMGNGVKQARILAEFLLESNPWADRSFTYALASFYVTEAGAEGVNHDVAFAQMCLETGFLSYGGLVTPEMNNFCGLGAIGPEQPGERFADPASGVRAHIQHLKAYASPEMPKREIIDPRYFYVRRGSSPAIKGLAGTWAVDKRYAEKINGILVRLYQFSLK